MKTMRLLYSLVILFFIVSCNEKIFTAGVDCDECSSVKYDSVDLIIDITIDDKYTMVPWTLYLDEVEKNVVDWVDTAYTSPDTIAVKVDKKYALMVKYAYNSDTICVIDATRIKWKHVSDECDDDCYVLVNNRIDATLKF